MKEPMWKQRFREAYEENHKREYPLAYKDHGLPVCKFPKVKTANGLTQFVVKFLNWKGHRATRINVQGRLTQGTERMPSGITLQVKKWQHSTTRRGTADVSSTIKIRTFGVDIGVSVQWEIKTGRDKPSEYQLKEQLKEQRAGGYYFFVHTPEEFFELYDSLFKTPEI
jgi:hypothetical protein